MCVALRASRHCFELFHNLLSVENGRLSLVNTFAGLLWFVRWIDSTISLSTYNFVTLTVRPVLQTSTYPDLAPAVEYDLGTTPSRYSMTMMMIKYEYMNLQLKFPEHIVLILIHQR